MSIELTWDDVRARSEHKSGSFTIFCADCRMNYDMVRMPCLRHCASEEERLERHERFKPLIKADVERLVRMFDGD